MPENCDIWADVDFGHGPVEVRCTKTGPHEDHSCNVLFVEETITNYADNTPVNGFNHRRNVFEDVHDDRDP